MVLNLRKYVLIILLLLSANLFANDNDLFFTDKYDVNYFSNHSISETSVYLGSDLFRFIDEQAKSEVIAFLDSFLITENIGSNNSFEFIELNKIHFTVNQYNALQCNQLSRLWNEKYIVKFRELLFKKLSELNINEEGLSAENMIFRKLMQDEKTRFYNPGNSINTVEMAFIIPSNLSANDFKKTFTHFNTKRYNGRESQLNATEIFINNSLKENELSFYYPSLNKQTFLRNSLSLTILKNIYKNYISFENKYFINQVISRFKIEFENENINELNIKLAQSQFSKQEFTQLVNEAVTELQTISANNLFYYSYYDMEKLKVLIDDYNQEDFLKEVELINNRAKYNIEINENCKIKFEDEKLLSFNVLDFDKKITFQTNSINFENESDSVLLNKVIQFLKVNNNFGLAISSTSKKSEYLFIEKDKREALTEKYLDLGYVISKKKDLSLFRSLGIFNTLTASGISYKRLKCAGLKSKKAELTLNLISLDEEKK